MVHPDVLISRPSFILTLLGGLVGMLLLSALIFVGPLLGFPFVDFPSLVGGIFTSNPDVAFWLGFGLFFLTGFLVFSSLLWYLWPNLPERDIGFLGAAVKGLIWGVALWVVSGLLIPVMSALNQLPEMGNPGLFALNLGLLAPVGTLLGHLAFGLATALVAAMGQGMEPTDTVGWRDHYYADTRPSILRREGRDVP